MGFHFWADLLVTTLQLRRKREHKGQHFAAGMKDFVMPKQKSKENDQESSLQLFCKSSHLMHEPEHEQRNNSFHPSHCPKVPDSLSVESPARLVSVRLSQGWFLTPSMAIRSLGSYVNILKRISMQTSGTSSDNAPLNPSPPTYHFRILSLYPFSQESYPRPTTIRGDFLEIRLSSCWPHACHIAYRWPVDLI